MKISDNQIRELWKVKITFYSRRKPRWVWETFSLPLWLLFLAAALSGFDRNVIMLGIVIGGVHLVVTTVILCFIYRMKARRLQEGIAYPRMAFLYSFYDLLMLMMFVISLFITGVQSISDLNSTSSIIQWLLYLSLAVIVASGFFSPRILNYKNSTRMDNRNLDRYLPLGLSISGSVIGFAIFMSALLTQSGEIETLHLVGALLLFVGAMSLLPFVVFGLSEVMVLVLNKWPRVKKSGSTFVFLEE